MFKVVVLSLFVLSCSALADVPETFAGAVRCDATMNRYTLGKGDARSVESMDVLLTKKGYNNWVITKPAMIDLSGGYRLTLTSVTASSTRTAPEDLRLMYSGRLSKVTRSGEKVLAIGASEEASYSNFISMNLSSLEQAQASVDSQGIESVDELIKGKFLPDNYVTGVSVECFMSYNK